MILERLLRVEYIWFSVIAECGTCLREALFFDRYIWGFLKSNFARFFFAVKEIHGLYLHFWAKNREIRFQSNRLNQGNRITESSKSKAKQFGPAPKKKNNAILQNLFSQFKKKSKLMLN